MVAQLPSCLVSLGSSRRHHACRVFASRSLGDASLANLPPEAGLYACLFGGLVFWIFCGSRQTVDLCHLRDLARDRLVAWGNYGREYHALWRPRGRHGVIGLAHRIHCLARESRSHGPFHLGECYDRIQIWRGAFPCQHSIAEAFRFPQRSWKLSGRTRAFSSSTSTRRTRCHC